MDKLTWYDEDGRLYCRRGYEVALARLASYEATELMPDEIVKMGMMFEDISSYRCATCNGETPLHDLTSAHIRCKCGKHFKYRTNFEEDVFTYSCLSCGAPVDLAYNKKARAYQTVR